MLHYYIIIIILQVLCLRKMQAACIDEPFECDTDIEAKATNGMFDLHCGSILIVHRMYYTLISFINKWLHNVNYS
jgi:hypothetical protein